MDNSVIGSFLGWILSSGLLISTWLLFFLTGNNISLSHAFAAMQVFKLLEVPLKWIPLIINSIIEFTVSMKRINLFLICKEMNPNILSIKKFEAFNEKDIMIENANFTWGGHKNEKQIKGNYFWN